MLLPIDCEHYSTKLLLLLLFFFSYHLLLAISRLLGKFCLKKNGEDVTILLLRDTVTASWHAYVTVSFSIKFAC